MTNRFNFKKSVRIIFTTTLFCAMSFGFMSKVMAQPDSNFYIFLCFGQSNMEGQATPEKQDKENISDRYKMMAAVSFNSPSRRQYVWYKAIPPLCRQSTGLCPVDYFGRTLVENLPDSITIGVINVAVAGTAIEFFDKNYMIDYPGYQSLSNYGQQWYMNIMQEYKNQPYQALLQCAKQAQKSGVIKGILIHQGETNNGQADWIYKVKLIYNNLLTDLGLEAKDVPLLAGETVSKEAGGSCWGHNAVIAKLPTVIKNSYVISSAGCPMSTLDGQNVHFTAEGYRILGRRYGEQMLKCLEAGSIDIAEIGDSLTDGVFPMDKNVIDANILLEGKVLQSGNMISLSSAKGGVAGWYFHKTADLSQARYLVIDFKKAPSSSTKLRIYDAKKSTPGCYVKNLEAKTRNVIDLKNIPSTVDLSHISTVGFATEGNSIYLTGAFLSDDGENPINAIEPINLDRHNLLNNGVYNLNGTRITNGQIPSIKGIYIHNGKKILIK
ncbi:MAG: hypothetical protein KBT06_02670 [Prevotellaceae bacterium]|nr:hypothetical protein [Candidatus Colivivens equi]